MMQNVNDISDTLIIKHLSHADYEQAHAQMLARTLDRIAEKKAGRPTPDELWLVEHNDVYTLGQAGKREHILNVTNTPIIQTDRGGQVTWHGTGQLVMYWLFDLNRLGWSVRDLVSHAEQCVEDVLNAQLEDGLMAHARQDAPGVYIYKGEFDVNHPEKYLMGKIASLGFKIKHGFSYHGLALNVRCNLTAFDAINPCGYQGMRMLNVQDVSKNADDLNYVSLFDLPLVTAMVENIEKRRMGEIELK